MLEQLKHKNAWKRTVKYFVFLFLFYAVVKYLLRDSDTEYFSYKTFTHILGFSLLMSVIFLFTFKPEAEPGYHETKEEIASRKFSYYANFFIFLALGLVVLGSLLLLAGVLIFKFVSNELLSASDFLKPITTMIVMALLFTLYSYISDRIQLSRGRRAAS